MRKETYEIRSSDLDHFRSLHNCIFLERTLYEKVMGFVKDPQPPEEVLGISYQEFAGFRIFRENIFPIVMTDTQGNKKTVLGVFIDGKGETTWWIE